jgi:hypothetical protein
LQAVAVCTEALPGVIGEKDLGQSGAREGFGVSLFFSLLSFIRSVALFRGARYPGRFFQTTVVALDFFSRFTD